MKSLCQSRSSETDAVLMPVSVADRGRPGMPHGIHMPVPARPVRLAWGVKARASAARSISLSHPALSRPRQSKAEHRATMPLLSLCHARLPPSLHHRQIQFTSSSTIITSSTLTR